MKKVVFVTIMAMALNAISHAEDVSLTIYNNNLGLVKQVKTLDFKKGIAETKFDDVAGLIDPTSVHIKPKADGIRILEQNYRYDLVSTQKIMQKYIGQEISIIVKEGAIHRGEILSFDGNFVALRDKTGEITITNTDEIIDYKFGQLPEGLILKPTLVWLADADKAQKSECEVSYLTDGMNWHAEYVAVVDKDDKNLDLSGWVSIDNNCGTSFRDASIKLVAGTVNRAQEPITHFEGMRSMDMLAKAAPQFQEEAFFEYHLYTLKRRSDVLNNETKQVSLFPETRTSANKVYTVESGSYGWRGSPENPKVKVSMEFMNSENAGLGIPLPKGKLRVYKADSEGKLQFIGEDFIDHTPKDEKARVFLGEVFDVTCERKKIDVVNLGEWHKRETYEIKIKNHKDTDIEVIVVESALGWTEWKITKSSIPYNKVSQRRVEFMLPVASDSENSFTYTLEY